MPNVCMNFLNQILTYIYNLLTSGTKETNELIMFNFSWDPRGNEGVRVVKQKFLSQNVLPSWYTSQVFDE